MIDDAILRIMRLGAAGYCCSQIIIGLFLEDLGRENPDLTAAAQGLCHGAGDCAGVCGVLTGSALALGLYAGKGGDMEEAHDRLPLLLAELNDWFRETVGARHGGIACSDIAGADCTNPDREVCGRLVAEAYGRICDLLLENGLDPAEGRRA